MPKPTVFLSHSSQDKKVLLRLEEILKSKTRGAVDLFLSCDGDSIPFGRNWVHEVEAALSRAELMVVFVSPSSQGGRWLHFEAGHAYARGLEVIPIGILGTDLTMMPPPLGLLQGFNITSEQGLNNLLATLNKKFGLSLALDCSVTDYDDFCSAAPSTGRVILGEYAHLVDQFFIATSANTGLEGDPTAAFATMVEILRADKLQLGAAPDHAEGPGVSLELQLASLPPPIAIRIDASVADQMLPLVLEGLRRVRTRGVVGVRIRVDFVESVENKRELHKISGPLHGAGVAPDADGWLAWKGLAFRLARLLSLSPSGAPRQGAAYLELELREPEFSPATIRELLVLLFDRSVLRVA